MQSMTSDELVIALSRSTAGQQVSILSVYYYAGPDSCKTEVNSFPRVRVSVEVSIRATVYG